MSIRKWATLAVVLSLFGLGVNSSQAHHSTAMFDSTKKVMLQGTVKKWSFTNPHSWLYVVVTDAQGVETVWELEGGSTSHMARNGWTYKSLKSGDKITVSISPRVDGQPGGSFSSVTLSDGTVLSSSPAV
ncbi:MAG: DUF6152 family protein [Steroidobacteraceae bacterium]